MWMAFGCASASSATPTVARPLPQDTAVVQRALEDFGRRLYGALVTGRPDGVILDEAALRTLLNGEAAERAIALRRTAPALRHVTPDERALFGSAHYAGICVQQGRAEPGGGPLGLRSAGFQFERALVVGQEPGGGAIASWVEGHFVNTSAGFTALAVERVEPPRRDHADLELAVCELRAGAYAHNP
jgi:hypothetical protein